MGTVLLLPRRLLPFTSSKIRKNKIFQYVLQTNILLNTVSLSYNKFIFIKLSFVVKITRPSPSKAPETLGLPSTLMAFICGVPWRPTKLSHLRSQIPGLHCGLGQVKPTGSITPASNSRFRGLRATNTRVPSSNHISQSWAGWPGCYCPPRCATRSWEEAHHFLIQADPTELWPALCRVPTSLSACRMSLCLQLNNPSGWESGLAFLGTVGAAVGTEVHALQEIDNLHKHAAKE